MSVSFVPASGFSRDVHAAKSDFAVATKGGELVTTDKRPVMVLIAELKFSDTVNTMAKRGLNRAVGTDADVKEAEAELIRDAPELVRLCGSEQGASVDMILISIPPGCSAETIEKLRSMTEGIGKLVLFRTGKWITSDTHNKPLGAVSLLFDNDSEDSSR